MMGGVMRQIGEIESMNNTVYSVSTAARVPTAVVNKTLRNTYALLGMLFVFASGTAYIAQAMHWRIGLFPFLIGIIAFSWGIAATRRLRRPAGRGDGRQCRCGAVPVLQWR